MKTFKQFLTEETELLFEETFHRKEIGPTEHYYHHDAHIHGKHVHVYLRSYHDYPGHYSANFSVDGSMNHKDSNPHENRHILHHIHKVVDSFIKEKKPKSLGMTASDIDGEKRLKKVHAYQKAAEHIAKRHGGKVTHHPGDGAEVEFH